MVTSAGVGGWGLIARKSVLHQQDSISSVFYEAKVKKYLKMFLQPVFFQTPLFISVGSPGNAPRITKACLGTYIATRYSYSFVRK